MATTTNDDVAAFGDSFDFSGVQVEQITDVSYWTLNDGPERPGLRIEINPHKVADDQPGGVFEFTTLVHQPPPGGPGWVEHQDVAGAAEWWLTEPDTDPTEAAISLGLYFGLGQSAANSVTAVDAFELNGFQFDFESDGVFVTH